VPDSPTLATIRFVFCTVCLLCGSVVLELSGWVGKIDTSLETRFLAQSVTGIGLPLSAMVAIIVCRRSGLSLERQNVSPFPETSDETALSSAELRSFVQAQTWRTSAWLMVGVSFSMVALGFYVQSKSKATVPVWEIASFFLSGAAFMRLLAYCARRGAFIARASESGLDGTNAYNTRLEVPWSQIAGARQIENFNLFGTPTGVTVEFLDEDGQVRVRVPLSLATQNQQHEFSQVVARYLQPTNAPEFVKLRAS